MNYPKLFRLTALSYTHFLLIAIGGCLIGINLHLFFQDINDEILILHSLFFVTLIFIIWEKRKFLNLESGIFSNIVGLAILLIVFLNATLEINFGGLLILSPLMSGFGLALLASGFKGLKQYIPELLALFFLSAHKFILIFRFMNVFINDKMALLTAKFSHFILWYSGFQVTRSGVNINLPTGGIEVYAGCSGMTLILNLLGLGLLFILIFNLNLQQKILVSIIAPFVAFVVNGIRVVLMAILVANGEKEAFKYWHEGDGSLIFSLIASLLFGCFCWFLLNINERKNQNIQEN